MANKDAEEAVAEQGVALEPKVGDRIMVLVSPG